MITHAGAFILGAIVAAWFCTEQAKNDRAGLRVQVEALKAAVERLKKGVS